MKNLLLILALFVGNSFSADIQVDINFTCKINDQIIFVNRDGVHSRYDAYEGKWEKGETVKFKLNVTSIGEALTIFMSEETIKPNQNTEGSLYTFDPVFMFWKELNVSENDGALIVGDNESTSFAINNKLIHINYGSFHWRIERYFKDDWSLVYSHAKGHMVSLDCPGAFGDDREIYSYLKNLADKN